MTSAVAAPIGQSSTPRPGLSDFGLTPSQIAAASQAQATVTPPLKPGLSDFGRTNPLLGVPTGSVDTSPTQQTVAISRTRVGAVWSAHRGSVRGGFAGVAGDAYLLLPIAGDASIAAGPPET